MHVALQEHMRVQRDIDLSQCGADVLLGVQVDATERFLDFACPVLGQVDIAVIGIGGKVLVGVLVANKLSDQPDDLQPRRLTMCGSGQHQGHQRLVDQHGVGFVDESHVWIGRYQVIDISHQLIAQYIEANLVDRGIGDITVICGPALVRGRVRGDPADRQAHRVQQRAHPLRIAAGQVIVNRHDVHVPAGQRITGGRDRPGKGFALTGGHLDHVSGEHAQRAKQLHIKWSQPGPPLGGFPGNREKLRDIGGLREVVEVEQACRLTQLLVGQIGSFLVVFCRSGYIRQGAAPVLFGAGAEQSPESAAQPAGLSAGGLGHKPTVRECRPAARVRVCTPTGRNSWTTVHVHGPAGRQARLDRRG